MNTQPWQPLILDPASTSGARQLAELRASGAVREIHDTLTAQRRDWARVCTPDRKLDDASAAARSLELTGDINAAIDGYWVFYPWSGRLVRVLPPEAFECVRTNRNRNKITADEQSRLAKQTVGIVGLSVGNAVARTILLEGAAGCLKLADFDALDLSNLNRLQAGVHEIGVNKAVLAARQILELNPYARVLVYAEGITESNVDGFLTDDPPVNVLVDECDSLDVKLLLRERARALHLPVLMETSDRGLLDVERFDLEPGRPIFHGRVQGLDRTALAGLSTADKVVPVLEIVGLETISARMGASLVEVGRTLSTWPQLGGEVALGGATVTAAVRRIGLGQPLRSGRVHVDLAERLDTMDYAQRRDVAAPGGAASPPRISVESDPTFDDHRFIVEHAALAPSGGNCQPWRFESVGALLRVLHDRSRATNLLDVGYRASALALGAAVENATIAAAARGLMARVEPSTDATDPELVATMSFEPDTGIATKEMATWLTAVKERVTNRRNQSSVALDVNEMDALTAAASEAGGAFEAVIDPATLARVGRALGETDRIRFLCPQLHRDMIGEVRWTQDEVVRTRDGLDLATLELSPADHAALRLLARPDIVANLRALDAGTALIEGAVKAVRHAAGLGLVRVPGNSFPDFLKAGRTVQRVWLAATRRRLAFHPMSAVTFMSTLVEEPGQAGFTDAERASIRAQYECIQSSFPAHAEWTPAFLFRLTRASCVTARSLRRPLAEIWSVRVRNP